MEINHEAPMMKSIKKLEPFWHFLCTFCFGLIIAATVCAVAENQKCVRVSQLALCSTLFASPSNLHFFRRWTNKKIIYSLDDWSQILALIVILLPNIVLISNKTPAIWHLGTISVQIVAVSQSLLVNCEVMLQVLGKLFSMVASFVGVLLLLSCFVVTS